jgi:hypothetical protein
MAASQSWNNKNLEDLYKHPWFFGELSEENAKEILVEAKQNDEKSEAKTILFLKTSFDDIKQNHFTIVLGHLSQHALNGQPQFYFHENYPYSILQNLVMRKNPFSLQELVKVKTATSVVDPKTLKLPKMIKD